MSDTGMRMRLDLWLWHARFFKTRTLASKMVKAKKIRVNGVVVAKASASVQQNDILTFVKDAHVRVIKVKLLTERRGPYSEAVLHYEDLSPQADTNTEDNKAFSLTNPARDKGMGRPTKKDRRAFEKLTDFD